MPSEWVYGGIFPGTGDYSIIYGAKDGHALSAQNLERHIVYSDTVGQYIGILDKNGKRIFEGDIISIEFEEDITPGETSRKWHDIAVVQFSEIYHGWYACFGKDELSMFEYDDPSCVEVIGNIYDNEELDFKEEQK